MMGRKEKESREKEGNDRKGKEEMKGKGERKREGRRKQMHLLHYLLEFMSQESTRIKNFKEIKMHNMNGELKFKC